MNGSKYEMDVEMLGFGGPAGELDEFGGDEFEGEFRMDEMDESRPPLTEMDEMEFAAELLDVSNERELDRILSGLLGRIARRSQRRGRSGNWPRFLRNSRLVRNLKNLLKGCIRRTQAAAASGAEPVMSGKPAVQPVPTSADAAAAADAPTAEEILGLELEGLSPEDRDFEIARQIVRLAEEAATQAVKAPAEEDPASAARSAMAAAARRYAPGFLRRRARRCDGHHPCSCTGCAGRSKRGTK